MASYFIGLIGIKASESGMARDQIVPVLFGFPFLIVALAIWCLALKDAIYNKNTNAGLDFKTLLTRTGEQSDATR